MEEIYSFPISKTAHGRKLAHKIKYIPYKDAFF
jgi:hypothetical protein